MVRFQSRRHNGFRVRNSCPHPSDRRVVSASDAVSF
jgi:hypothetical protein